MNTSPLSFYTSNTTAPVRFTLSVNCYNVKHIEETRKLLYDENHYRSIANAVYPYGSYYL